MTLDGSTPAVSAEISFDENGCAVTTAANADYAAQIDAGLSLNGVALDFAAFSWPASGTVFVINNGA